MLQVRNSSEEPRLSAPDNFFVAPISHIFSSQLGLEIILMHN